MGGVEAQAELMERFPDTKVIVSSGYSNDPIMSEFEEYGFVAVLAKALPAQKTIHCPA